MLVTSDLGIFVYGSAGVHVERMCGWREAAGQTEPCVTVALKPSQGDGPTEAAVHQGHRQNEH